MKLESVTQLFKPSGSTARTTQGTTPAATSTGEQEAIPLQSRRNRGHHRTRRAGGEASASHAPSSGVPATPQPAAPQASAATRGTTPAAPLPDAPAAAAKAKTSNDNVPAEVRELMLPVHAAWGDLNEIRLQAMEKGIDPFLPPGPAPHPDDATVRDQFWQAQDKYLTLGSRAMWQVTKMPAKDVDPSLRRWGVNAAAQFAVNLSTFTAPTVIAAVLDQKAGFGPLATAGVYAGAIGLMSVAGPELQSVISRKLGGADYTLKFSLGNHGMSGLYKEMMGALGLTLTGVVLHGLTHLTVTSQQEAWAGSIAGQGGRAALSGAAMSVGVQALVMGGAAITKWRNGVKQAAEYPAMDHTRSLKGGIFLSETPKYSDRTTPAHKRLELAVRAVAATVAAAGALFPVTWAIAVAGQEGKLSAKEQSAASVLGGYTAFFTLMTAMNLIIARLAMDAKLHIGRFGKAERANQIEQLQRGTFAATEKAIDQLAVSMEKGAFGEAVQETFSAMTTVMNGQAFRDALPRSRIEDPTAHQARVTRLGERVDTLTTLLHESAGHFDDYASERKDQLVGTSLKQMAEKLRAVEKSIRSAHDGYDTDTGGQLFPELSDAGHRVSDATTLLLQAMVQLGGRPDLKDAPELEHAGAALALLSAVVAKVEKQEKAADFVRGMMHFAQHQATRTKRQAGGEWLDEHLLRSPHPRSATGTIQSLSGLAKRPGMVDEIMGNVQRTAQDPQALLDAVRLLLRQAMPSAAALQKNEAAVKLVLLENRLAVHVASAPGAAQPAPSVEAQEQRCTEVVNAFVTRKPDDAARRFLVAFRNGEFTAEQLNRLVLRHLDTETHQVPVSSAPAPAGRLPDAALNAFSDAVGPKVIQALRDELQPLVHVPDDGHAMDRLVADKLVGNLWNDAMGMPKTNRTKLMASMSLPTERPVPGVPVTVQKDIHAHPLDNYNGVLVNMFQQILHNWRHGVVEMTAASIPHQIVNSTGARKYYTAFMNRTMDYVNRDPSAIMQRFRLQFAKAWIDMGHANQVKALQRFCEVNEKDKNALTSIHVSTTGVDPTDRNAAKRDLRRLVNMMNDLGAAIKEADIPDDTVPDIGHTGSEVKTMGETTLRKEHVGHLTPREIRISGESSENTLSEAFIAGQATIVHADNGDSHLDKRGNSQEIEAVLERLANFVNHWQGADPVRNTPGFENAASVRMNLVHAHIGGLAKTISDKPDAFRYLHGLLNRPVLKTPNVNFVLDVSWNFMAHMVQQNTYDMLKRRERVLPQGSTAANNLHDIARYVQNILTSDRSAEEKGMKADTSDDMGWRLGTAAFRTGMAPVTDLHMGNLAYLSKRLLLEAFRDQTTREMFRDFARYENGVAPAAEGDPRPPRAMEVRGNNPIWFFNEHKNDLLFGSDHLAVGIKGHGADSFAINQRMYEFIYAVYDELGKYYPEFQDVSAKIARENYDKVVHDPHNARRREDFARYTAEHRGQWGSSPAFPENYFQRGLLDKSQPVDPALMGDINSPPARGA